jgi:hypothetical protein
MQNLSEKNAFSTSHQEYTPCHAQNTPEVMHKIRNSRRREKGVSDVRASFLAGNFTKVIRPGIPGKK